MTAIGVIREAYDREIKIPADLSVVGFDDIRLAQFTTPPLTTVRMSQKELAEIAFRALLGTLDPGSSVDEKREHELVTHLVLRSSTALVRSPRETPKRVVRRESMRRTRSKAIP